MVDENTNDIDKYFKLRNKIDYDRKNSLPPLIAGKPSSLRNNSFNFN